jgi:hypothetical protein
VCSYTSGLLLPAVLPPLQAKRPSFQSPIDRADLVAAQDCLNILSWHSDMHNSPMLLNPLVEIDILNAAS